MDTSQEVDQGMEASLSHRFDCTTAQSCGTVRLILSTSTTGNLPALVVALFALSQALVSARLALPAFLGSCVVDCSQCVCSMIRRGAEDMVGYALLLMRLWLGWTAAGVELE